MRGKEKEGGGGGGGGSGSGGIGGGGGGGVASSPSNHHADETRPWTPNSGSDVLLLRPNQSNSEVQERLYQHQNRGKLQKLGISPTKPWLRDERGRALAPLSSENSVDQSDTASLSTDKSWADQSGVDEYREYGRSPKNRRLPGLGGRQGQGDDDYPRRSSLLSSPVFIKDHRVGMMSDYTKNKATFSSHALTLEAELKELLFEQQNRKFLPKHGDHDPTTFAPDVVASRRMMSGLSEIAERPGTYQKVLMMISQNLHSLVFAPTSEDDVGQPPIPYFALCAQLRSQVKKLEVELGVAYQNMEEGEAGEGGGGSPKKNKRADSKIVYGDVRAKEEEIKTLRKSNEELNKVVADITRKVNVQQRELEELARKIENDTAVSTQVKGAFLRTKKELMNASSDLMRAEDQAQDLFSQMQEMVPKSEFEELRRRLGEAGQGTLSRVPSSDEKVELGEEEIDTGAKGNGGGTPRPKWERMPAEVAGPAGFIKGRIESTASNVNKLVTYIKVLQSDNTAMKLQRTTVGTGPAHKNKADEEEEQSAKQRKHIQCLGTGAEVPKYLRFQGKVRNRRMAKRDAEKAVRDIWAMKAQHDMGKKPEERIHMQEFFYTFCLKKFGAFQNMIAEWSYNVLAVLEGNRHDSDCDTFLKVLHGELSEDVYHDQHNQVRKCIAIAEEIDKEENSGLVSGKCNKAEFMALIEERLHKNQAEIDNLQLALDAVYGERSHDFKYDKLFAEDRNFSQNEFAEEFKAQIIKEREDHIELLKKIVGFVTDKEGNITIAGFRKEMRKWDANKPEKDMVSYLNRGCSVAAPPHPETINAELFLTNLLKGVVKPGNLSA